MGGRAAGPHEQMSRQSIVITACRDPCAIVGWTQSELSDLLAGARAAGILARLAITLREKGLLEKLPAPARLLFEEGVLAVERNQTDIRFETNRIARALSHLDVPIVVLKGGAYILADLPPARGRLASDLDILVPRERLQTVESALIEAGWEPAQMNEYDQRYYREWMHEIPPVWHPDRQIVTDIHHTIMPLTGRANPDSAALLAAARPVTGSRLKVLCPPDMVLHSATHLFSEQFLMGLRDLLDLHDLLEHFGSEDRFWTDLVARARLHGLGRTLFYLLRYSERLLATPIPAGAKRDIEWARPPKPVLALMDKIVTEALTPSPGGSRQPTVRAVALWMLYLRSHWLKMPPGLLTKHLIVKSVRRWRESSGLGTAEP